ncbi:GL25706 [Drosophila persimilis]|uniref:GL25706 n=1 Tax=Drosophila persimilis TaxID=7234 RepID=B4GKC6_DROPE|nr:vitelline membrane protein Vm34Ca [Drosophila persimilis]EDW37092.1 GL25706 [Drosophila persimilis]
MKFVAIIATICLLGTSVAAEKRQTVGSAYGGGYEKPAAAPSYSAPAAPSYSAPAAPSYSAPAAPAYAAAPAAPAYAAPAPVSIPAPPCPKNYLFSCQPNLAPVPCSAPAPSYGSAGAYSQYAPVYAPQPLQW